eukprot:jgi/Hompol1/6847/HPOL_001316-RA
MYGYGTGGLDIAGAPWPTMREGRGRGRGGSVKRGIAVDKPRSSRPRVFHGDRICEYCQATETPMWRRGPSGKSTLCNKCGVKWRSGRLLTRPDGSFFGAPNSQRNAIGKMAKPTTGTRTQAAQPAYAAVLPASKVPRRIPHDKAAAIAAAAAASKKLSKEEAEARAIYDMRRHLANTLSSGALDNKHLAHIITVIRSSVSIVSTGDEEMELDIEAMSPQLVSDLYQYIINTAGILPDGQPLSS